MSTRMNSVYDARFVHPATHLCVGPPSSGKTYKMARIIENVDKLFREKDYSSARINNVVFCYAAWQPVIGGGVWFRDGCSLRS